MSNLKNGVKVSIIIPVYNGANFLRDAIDSALAQTYKNIEVLVVNDGSNDDGETEKIARSYGNRICYHSKTNGGVSSALNCGIAHMTGSYFSWLSHDDLYAPTKIADAVALLQQTPEADEYTIAYTCGHYIDNKGNLLRHFPTDLSIGRLYSGKEMVHHCVRNKTLNGCCMLIPKKALLESGGFAENLRYSQDALMWYRLFFQGCSLVYDGKPNVMYRLHNAQTSQTRRDLFEHDAKVIAEELAPVFLKIDANSNVLLFHYAKKMAKYKCYEVVRYLKMTAGKTCPFSIFQKICLATLQFYGSIRGQIKNIYYRFFLKVKVR